MATRKKTEPATEPAETSDSGPPPEPPAATIAETADDLIATLQTEPDPPKKRRGRPPGSGKKTSERVTKTRESEQAAKAQRVSLFASALTSTIGPIVERADLQPPFTNDQGTALAEIWDPIIVMYMNEGGPWTVALAGTGVIMAPYIIQVFQRRMSRNVESERPDNRPAGSGENATRDSAS